MKIAVIKLLSIYQGSRIFAKLFKLSSKGKPWFSKSIDVKIEELYLAVVAVTGSVDDEVDSIL